MKKRLAQTRAPDGVLVERPWRPYELFTLYMRGWTDAAATRAMRADHIDVPEYDKGYRAGKQARCAVVTRTASRFGYKPEILRLTEKADEHKQRPR